jgi:signal transduction histidine kinase
MIETLIQNAEKITVHGRRADNIVRSMMQHSRGKSGKRELSDINALVDQALNLTYHGLRAQNASFNVTIERDFDDTLGQIEVLPQDLSRVFLNLINNACYAVHEKDKERRGEGENGRKGDGIPSSPAHPVSPDPLQPFKPALFVSTKNHGDRIEIRIRDNGNGIPRDIREKIFNPFFTTKPSGQGTGLGLSISYDIIVHQHKGEIRVETEEGKFTEFLIYLPKS